MTTNAKCVKCLVHSINHMAGVEVYATCVYICVSVISHSSNKVKDVILGSSVLSYHRIDCLVLGDMAQQFEPWRFVLWNDRQHSLFKKESILSCVLCGGARKT